MDNQSRQFLETIHRYCEKNTQYPPDAYSFLVEAFNTTEDQRKQTNPNIDMDMSAKVLLEGIREYALERFGSMAFHVLSEWNIHTTMDFGNIVFNLVNIGIFGKSEDDTLDDFFEVYSFEDAFIKPFQP